MSKPIAVIAEVNQGAIHPLTFEMLACAAALRKLERAPVALLAAGPALQSAAGQLAALSGLPVTVLDFPESPDCGEDQLAAALAAELKPLDPSHVCLGHTTRGLSLAGSLATALKAACICGVEGIETSRGRIRFLRPVHGGKFVTQVETDAAATVLTVQPGAFEPLMKKEHSAETRVTIRSAAPSAGRIRHIGKKSSPADSAALADARVIVSAGRGIGDSENLALIEQLAARFPRSAVAGSRIVCDLGWLDYSRQVGATGMSVSPELYIACGISGAVQHVMGMRASKFVVAINTDPNAAIFREADVCVVEDLKAFIPALIEALESRGGA